MTFTSPMSILANCTIHLVQPTTYSGTTPQGNPKRTAVTLKSIKCYLKSARTTLTPPDQTQQSVWLEGYAITETVLPGWVTGNTVAKIEFTDGSKGEFIFVPKVHIARELVETVTGARVQGWFVQRI